MLEFLIRRLSLMSIALLGILFITFTITYIVPGDPARALAGRWATEEQIEAVREKLGLNQPLFIQFGHYVKGLIHGELGKSIVSQRPIMDELGDYFLPTLELILVAMFINVILAVPLGVFSAVHQGGVLDYLSRILAVIGAAAPVFWVGLLLQILFYKQLHILPIGGRLDFLITPPTKITGLYLIDSLFTGNWTAFGDSLAHIILPALTLGLGFVAVIARITRSSMLSVLSKDFVRTAWAKGLETKKVIYKHALKNAIIPTVTVMGMQLGWMMGGTVLIETVFSWGGMGFWGVTAIRQNDFPVVMAVMLIISLIFVVANFCVDLLYMILDPRVRYV